MGSTKRFAVIADIHSNLNALKAVLVDIRAQHCTDTFCLGDIVGYGWNPKECVDLIRASGMPCVRGNHDEYCSADDSLEGFNPTAARVLQWTRDQLTAEDRKWLRELPLVQVISGFTIVHATLGAPERWGYVFDRLAAASSLALQNTPVCFFGHTHVPVGFVRDSTVRGGTFRKFTVEKGRQYFINVGSVGQPRDQNPKAAYVIYDQDNQEIELRRVDFPRSEPPPGFGGGPDAPLPVPAAPGGKPPFLKAALEPPRSDSAG